MSLHRNIWSDGDTFLLPVYESKLVNSYDHRFATYVTTTTLREMSVEEKSDPATAVTPRYWVRKTFFETLMQKYQYNKLWFVSYRDVARATDARTMIATIIPRVPASRKQPVLGVDNALPAHLLVANLNSFVVDFVARQSVGGISLSFFILKQLPIVPPNMYDSVTPWTKSIDSNLLSWLSQRISELSYTSQDLRACAIDMGYNGPPFCWDEDRRFLLRCELDAAYFHVYGIARDDVDYIMETFPIVKRKDIAKHGEYRTKRVILEIYDEMADAMQGGAPYQTRLDPPPADPRVAHPSR